MPWKESTKLNERKEFVAAWLQGGDLECFSDLCGRFGISRQTGYKWIKRFETEGDDGLRERSRAPLNCPHAISEEIASRVIQARQQHPRWGPRKLRAHLQRQQPGKPLPATSSMGALLQREGLVVPRKVRQRTPRHSDPLAHADAPNRLWCADFKGWFPCGDGKRCDPLTMTDAYSRYLLRCQSVPKTDGVHVQAIFEAAFREYGLPVAIRTDNGPPFATTGPAGLSRLSMWWLRLGIQHERITPGAPQQNGRHERMHLTLKQETAQPPAANLRQQQRIFHAFQREYNEQRPHEALKYQTPASLYIPSPQLYPARLPELVYPVGSILRSIVGDGQLRWNGKRTYLSKVLAGERVGLLEVGEAFYEVYYGPLLLGWMDERENHFAPDRGAERKRPKPKEKTTQKEMPANSERLAPFP